MPDNDTRVNLNRREAFKAAGVAGGAMCLAGAATPARQAAGQTARKGLIRRRRSPWFSSLDGSAIRCELCPRRCRIEPGRRSPCRVRENVAGQGYTLVHGNPCLVQVDRIERMPFFHVLPGSRVLSVSTVGCNIHCTFCEAWDMALVGPEDVHAYDIPAAQLIRHARGADAKALSYTFGEPVVFYEYMAEAATLARKAGLLNLLHTNGYIQPEPLKALCKSLDAVNVDLKGFDEAFYREVCGGELAPVLDTLKRLKAAKLHVEITNILIPTLNDDVGRIREMCRWIRRELGPDVPLHFARFYPLYRLANLPPTPVATINRARAAAAEAGLRYVYVARVTGHEGENSSCHACGGRIIERTGFVVERSHLTEGRCNHCGQAIPGRWA